LILVLRNIPTAKNSSDVNEPATSPPRSYKEALMGSHPSVE
jgi:hypothetical protein